MAPEGQLRPACHSRAGSTSRQPGAEDLPVSLLMRKALVAMRTQFWKRMHRSGSTTTSTIFGSSGSRAATCLEETPVGERVGRLQADALQQGIHLGLECLAHVLIGAAAQTPADVVVLAGGVRLAEHVQPGRIPLLQLLLGESFAVGRGADIAQHLVRHLGVALLLTPAALGNAGERPVAGVEPFPAHVRALAVGE